MEKVWSFVKGAFFYTLIIGITALALYAGYIIYGVANELWGVFDITKNEFFITYDLDNLVRMHNELISNENLGTFGDFIGGTLNPILTFLTFICLIVTIWMQRTELNLTRKELKKSAEEQAKSANAANSQVAEATIFNLINLHRSIFNDIKYEKDESEHKSINAFKIFSEKNSCKVIIKSNLDYFTVAKSKSYVFGSYFRVLYQILLTIDSYDSNCMTDDQKKRYAKIVRSYLSTVELSLLMQNCLTDLCDKGEFKSLLIKYEMLKHLPINLMPDDFFTDKEGFSVSVYSIDNGLNVPEYFLYEYIEPLSGNSAFGSGSEITANLIKSMLSDKQDIIKVVKKIIYMTKFLNVSNDHKEMLSTVNRVMAIRFPSDELIDTGIMEDAKNIRDSLCYLYTTMASVLENCLGRCKDLLELVGDLDDNVFTSYKTEILFLSEENKQCLTEANYNITYLHNKVINIRSLCASGEYDGEKYKFLLDIIDIIRDECLWNKPIKRLKSDIQELNNAVKELVSDKRNFDERMYYVLN